MSSSSGSFEPNDHFPLQDREFLIEEFVLVDHTREMVRRHQVDLEGSLDVPGRFSLDSIV